MPQIHGEGAAADAIFTSIDNGIGYSVENLENAVANKVKPGSAPTGNSGEGADNSGTGSGGSGGPPPPGPGPKARRALNRRQLDKVAKGAQNLAGAGGIGASTETTTAQLEDIDGTLTNDAGDAGLMVGNTFADTLEGLTGGLNQ